MRRTWLVLDVLIVSVFVFIGRHVHGHPETLAGFASTAWPFLSAMALGWAVCAVVGRELTGPMGGVVVGFTTVAVAMALRVVAGQGTAVAFIVVSVCFLEGFMLLWRVVGAQRRRRGTSDVEGS